MGAIEHTKCVIQSRNALVSVLRRPLSADDSADRHFYWPPAIAGKPRAARQKKLDSLHLLW